VSKRSAPAREEIIEVLDCDLGARPNSAPGIDLLLPHVRGVARSTVALTVEFDERVADTLAKFVEAERLCCAGIGWEIEGGPGLRLRITANEAQLHAIESLWDSKHI
jgi:hypothetical protein